MGEIADDIYNTFVDGEEDQYDGWEDPAPDCPYCGESSVRMTQTEYYGREFNGNLMFVCRPCDATVGCHPDGRPLGSLADKELRQLRRACHDALDHWWKGRAVTRKMMYRFLREDTGVGHIGETSAEDCRKVLIWAKMYVVTTAPESEAYYNNGRDHERGGRPYRRP